MRKLVVGDLISHPAHFFALGFGSGLSPIAPGTFGTLAALPLYFLVMYFHAEYFLWWLLAAALVGIYLCDVTAKNLQSPDHGGIVWDEVVGYGVTMLWLPFTWQWALAGFVLFRLFDIIKPWPIRWLDRHVYGGFGIMLDDVIAGLFACVILHAANALI